MATTTELESLIVRLVGDGSSYQRMLADAQAATTTVASHIEAASKRIESLTSSITGFANSALSALSALGAQGFLKRAFDMFVETESATIRLTTAIEANGRAAGPALARYKDFADAMKDITGVAPDATIALLRQAETMGLSGANAEKAVRDAIGLSNAISGNSGAAGSYINTARAIQEGNAHALGRLPILKGIKDENEKLAKAEEMASRGLGLASSLMNSTEGIMRRFQGTIKGITKQFGSLVAEGVRPTVAWLTDLLSRFTSLDESLKRVVVSVAFFAATALSVGPALGTITAIATPLLRLFSSGFALAGRFLLFLISPIAIIRAAFLALSSVIGVIFSPLTLGIAAVVIGVSVLVYHLGGLSATWEVVKSAALEAWGTIKDAVGRFITWAEPVFAVFTVLVLSAWVVISEAAQAAWSFIKESGVSAISAVYDATVSWISTNRDLVVTLGVVTVALASVYGAYRLVLLSIAAVNSVVAILKIQQIASMLLWLAWKGVILVVSGAFLLLNAQLLFHKLMLAGGWLLVAAYSGAVLVAKAVTWLWNAALVVTNALLGGISLIGLIALVPLALLVAAGFAVMAAAVSGVVAGIARAVDLLLTIPTTSGPIGHIVALFREWYDIIREVIAGLSVNVPLATRLLSAGFELAVSQIKDLWPPLWRFVEEGWASVTEIAVAQMKIRYNTAIGEIISSLAERLGPAITMRLLPVVGAVTPAFNLERTEEQIRDARGRMAAALRAFNVTESPTTVARRAAVEEARNQLRSFVAESRTTGQEAGSQLTQAFKEAVKIDAVLFRSVEAMSRRANFLERLREGRDRAERQAETAGRQPGAVHPSAAAAGIQVPDAGGPAHLISPPPISVSDTLASMRPLLNVGQDRFMNTVRTGIERGQREARSASDFPRSARLLQDMYTLQDLENAIKELTGAIRTVSPRPLGAYGPADLYGPPEPRAYGPNDLYGPPSPLPARATTTTPTVEETGGGVRPVALTAAIMDILGRARTQSGQVESRLSQQRAEGERLQGQGFFRGEEMVREADELWALLDHLLKALSPVARSARDIGSIMSVDTMTAGTAGGGTRGTGGAIGTPEILGLLGSAVHSLFLPEDVRGMVPQASQEGPRASPSLVERAASAQDPSRDRMVQLLTQAVDQLTTIAAKPTVSMVPLGLT
jgi:hypothetical protein